MREVHFSLIISRSCLSKQIGLFKRRSCISAVKIWAQYHDSHGIAAILLVTKIAGVNGVSIQKHIFHEIISKKVVYLSFLIILIITLDHVR